ncbi:DUF2177 family protein [Albirhodobacter sp. R86504]|jgi:uncharacterized membrane protein|uniref:DUF2177 family protein n=1 Tax=Albirhodobacter sp. R86504 TaxID=3093848 RepID=UPI0036729884
MTLIILYLVTTFIFLAIDAVGISFFIKPLFDRHIADLYPEQMRVGPAAAFYLAYVAGVLWFVSWPALRDGDLLRVFMNGALLGLMCYGTYEFTNYATLKAWSPAQVVADTLWGGLLTGFSAWAGVVVTRMVTTQA